MKCNCVTCKESLRLAERDVRIVESLHRWLPLFRHVLPPLPPFKTSQKVRCVCRHPTHNFKYGETYTVESLFLSTNRTFWFIRAINMPSSTSADQFEAID
jgi:hypothetical protein